ncbi:MAG: glycerol-3-phosphate responsive antiterminator [Lachnospiraceae bacterium]|nr:glycerol-3-phosphate responsive antiterminator [Lachnospiraceae bacterium]
MTPFSQPILLAISQMKDFEKFLQSPLDTCILMDFHINLLPSMMQAAHAAGKTVYLHADLLRGVSADEFGCEYLCQRLRADGIISTKPKVLEAARRNRVATILRLFLIDTKSLDKGAALIKNLQPDHVELLPGLACDAIADLKQRLQPTASTQPQSFLCGGLIKTHAQITRCLEAGACAVTLSDRTLAEEYLARHS